MPGNEYTQTQVDPQQQQQQTPEHGQDRPVQQQPAQPDVVVDEKKTRKQQIGNSFGM